MQSKISKENRGKCQCFCQVFLLSKLLVIFKYVFIPLEQIKQTRKTKAKFPILKMTQLVDSLPVLSNSIPEYG